MSFTKIPVLLQQLFMKKLMILSTSFVSLMSTTNSISLQLDRFIQFLNTSSVCHNRLGTRVSESQLDSQRESALFVVPEESWFARFLSRDLVFLCCTDLANLVRARVSPFYHDWRTTTDRTTGFLLQSDRLVFGTHQRAPCRWWRHRSRSHSGAAVPQRIPGCSRHKPPECGSRRAHNLWEGRSPLHPGRWSWRAQGKTGW